ncbi:MAG: hypothetical protein ACPH5N_00430 [Pseudomonadales bacterium]
MNNFYRKLAVMVLLITIWQPVSASISNNCLDAIGKASSAKCVSILQLLAEPKKFHQQRVIVGGFLDASLAEIGFGKLYFHREDYEFMLLQNALDIDLFGTYSHDLDGHYVWVEGVFNIEGGNTMQPSLGTIKFIDNIYRHNLKRRNAGGLIKAQQ